MRFSGRQQGALANPILVGATTVLIVLVAVALSYNANDGLPFVPTYQVRVRVPDSGSLVKGADVRIGGKRVGTVAAIRARRQRDGTVFAEASLKLEIDVRPLPVDTAVTVRPRSPLGGRYIELKPGRSERGLATNESLPLANAQPVVELNEFADAFDAPTRRSLQRVVDELGGGLAARGLDINATLQALPALLPKLESVSANLARPSTELAGFVRGLSAAASAVAPQAERLGLLIEHADDTLAAFQREDASVRQILAELAPTERTGTQVLGHIRPVLADGAALARALRPGIRRLPGAAGATALAVEAGTPALRRVPALADRLDSVLRGVDGLVREPATRSSVRALTGVVSSLAPTLRFVNPFQVRCNYLGLWTRNIPSSIGEGDGNGNWFSFLPILKLDETLQRPDPAPDQHTNPYGSTGQDGECEIGNEPWLPGQRIGPVDGVQATSNPQTAPPGGAR